MSKEDQMKCIFIRMDCSKEGKSDIQEVKLCDVVEVHDITYTYEEIKTKEFTVIETDPEWYTTNKFGDFEVTVDLKSNVKIDHKK